MLGINFSHGIERSELLALHFLSASIQPGHRSTFTLKKMAAYTLRRVVESGLDSEATRISVELVSTDPGVAIPLNFVKGMRGDVDSWVKTEVSILEEHPSILVRRAVAKVLS